MTSVPILVTMLVGGVIPAVTTGEDVVRTMYERYAGVWYENLALVQTVTYYESQTGAFDSARVWYESIQLPGIVRSHIAPLDAGNSVQPTRVGEELREVSVQGAALEGRSAVVCTGRRTEEV